MKKFTLFLALVLALGSGLAFAQRAVRVQPRTSSGAEKRTALVIGNSKYKRISRLKNPVNDARDMAGALRESGFQVTLLLNAKRKEINQAIRKFGKILRQGSVGLFYFAGHGVQVEGANYLIPIGADINEEYEVQDEAVSVNRVMGMMRSAGNSLNMVFLDACRNNPYKGSFRTASRGLAAVPRTPKGSLISYATDAGAVAADGDGRNGIYTKNLLRYIRQPGLELSQLMKRVRSGVQRDTGGKQTPFELSSLTGDFYFRGKSATIASTQPRAAPQPRQFINAEEEFWNAVKVSKNPAHFRAYLAQHPNGRFAAIAKIKIDLLKPAPKTAAIRQKQGAAKPPPVAAVAPLTRPNAPLPDGQSDFKGMAHIPGGIFLMGDQENGPVHRVKISQYYMDQTEVTQETYKKTMGATPSEFYSPGDPVNRVSWHDAKRYCEKIGKRLPSEAEWEYAARAGTRSKYYFGKDQSKISKFSNFCGEGCETSHSDSSADVEPDGFVEIAPIKSLKPNRWKLYDMSGNVSEWVADWRGPYQHDDTENPKGPGKGVLKVHRGGSFEDTPERVTSAFRHSAKPETKRSTIGFRCAADVK